MYNTDSFYGEKYNTIQRAEMQLCMLIVAAICIIAGGW